MDVRAINDKVSDNWTHTDTSQAEFRSMLVERDRTCAVTGLSAEDCEACHCLPHCKGDEVSTSL